MCGIVGYTGAKQAAPLLLEGLSKLEYRGYDSAGVATRDGDAPVQLVKAKGRLKVLSEKINGGLALPGSCGIGHTRWATHGEPSEINAHPHCSDDMNVVAVHNGIIENYQQLKDKLTKKGYRFYSTTDTEVAVKLIDYYYKKYEGTPVDAINHAMVRIRGSYALAVMFKDYPGQIWAARKDSPMIIGVGKGETFLASDAPAILKFTRDVYYIGNMELGCLEPGKVTFYNLDGDVIEKPLTTIQWDSQAAEKSGYEYFMMKEIHEQPKAVADTLHAFAGDGAPDLSAAGLSDEDLKAVSSVCVVACGSAWHVGMTAQYVLEQLARVPVRVELASEFRYRQPLLEAGTLVVVISQSGETADSLAALREAKRLGARTLGIVNVVGSSIAREADNVLMQELETLPAKIEKILEDKERLQWFASKQVAMHDCFFIGRGIDYAISLEGSLKLKEISYIHSEAYAAGELKHGTISLIEEGTLVVGLATQTELYEKTVSNLVECKSRGAYLMGLTCSGNYGIEDTVDFAVYVPRTDPLFAASLAVVPLQLLSYYVAVGKGLDVDKPRNLAKSVTVE